MNFKELKQKIVDCIQRDGCSYYSFSALTVDVENESISGNGSFTCKQELCARVNKSSNQRVVFHKIIDFKKLKANLNKIEEILGVERSILCFLHNNDKTSLLLSDKSIWASNLLLTDFFCILFRSANLQIDITKIEDIFNDYNSLSTRRDFQNIIRNFPDFLKWTQEQNCKELYSRNLYGDYGVLDFYSNRIKHE